MADIYLPVRLVVTFYVCGLARLDQVIPVRNSDSGSAAYT